MPAARAARGRGSAEARRREDRARRGSRARARTRSRRHSTRRRSSTASATRAARPTEKTNSPRTKRGSRATRRSCSAAVCAIAHEDDRCRADRLPERLAGVVRPHCHRREHGRDRGHHDDRRREHGQALAVEEHRCGQRHQRVCGQEPGRSEDAALRPPEPAEQQDPDRKERGCTQKPGDPEEEQPPA